MSTQPDEIILRCYVPDCNREVARFKIASPADSADQERVKP